MKLLRIILIGVMLGLTACANATSSAATRLPDTPIAPPAEATIPRTPQHIVLLLPLSGPQEKAGSAIRKGFLAAYYQQKPASLTISLIDTHALPTIETAYQKAVQQGADFIVGPLEKKEVAAIDAIASLPVPTLALNYTTASTLKQNTFYEFGLSPKDEARQTADKAWQAGYRSALVITPAGSWGDGIAQTFQQHWIRLGGKVINNIAFQATQELAPQVRHLLQVSGADTTDRQRHRHDADIVFLVAPPAVARQINPLLKFYSADRLPVYATSLVYSGTPLPAADHDLNGIIFLDMPMLLNTSIRTTSGFSAKDMATDARLFALGADAYRVAMHLDALQTGPLAGMTGTLSLNHKQHILRHLDWAQFRDGKPTPL